VEDKGLLTKAIEFGRGIHILRQDALETVFSFLISQNNHIPRIKGIIERMCVGLGKDMGGYYAFPTLEAMAGAGEDYFSSIGAGYRASYLDRTAKTLLDRNFDSFKNLNTADLRSALMALHGVGRKVADCILLFGFNRFDVFPVDTWIKKVFEAEYKDVPADRLSVMLVDRYGEYAGFVQQWLFYYKREFDRQ
jgi:N-glycosylase/DNA lyase